MIHDLNAAAGEVIWTPSADLEAAAAVTRFAQFVRDHGGPRNGTYQELWRWSVAEPARFWELFAEFAGVRLGGEPDVVLSDDPMPGARWFAGRTVNFAQHVLADRDGTALISVSEDGVVREMSWEQLRADVASISVWLRDAGVGPGDRVVGILPNIPEAVVAFLATAALGAVWSVCAPEFGPGAITSRFAQLSPKVVIATPG